MEWMAMHPKSDVDSDHPCNSDGMESATDKRRKQVRAMKRERLWE